jgi:DNA-binding transcriptional ArsR family regulator
VLQALGDPTRRTMLERLTMRPHSVTHLAEVLGITPTAVGQHLQILQDAGLARSEKLGRTRTCALDTSGLSTLELWIKGRKSQFERQFDRLGLMLDEDEQG